MSTRPTLFNAADPPQPLPPISYPAGEPSEPALRLGPDLGDEPATRLIGQIEGRRVLQLGCGSGAIAIALARRGAKVIVVDPSMTRLARARRNAEANDTRIEFHHGDYADLAFIRADQIDLCLALYSLSVISDVSRVFRQVHRVERTEAPFLITLPHPLMFDTDFDDDEVPHLARRSGDPATIEWPDAATADNDEPMPPIVPHRISDMFTALTRSNFRVDMLLEPLSPEPDPTSPYWSELQRWVPASVVLRGRKQGI